MEGTRGRGGGRHERPQVGAERGGPKLSPLERKVGGGDGRRATEWDLSLVKGRQQRREEGPGVEQKGGLGEVEVGGKLPPLVGAGRGSALRPGSGGWVHGRVAPAPPPL